MPPQVARGGDRGRGADRGRGRGGGRGGGAGGGAGPRGGAARGAARGGAVARGGGPATSAGLPGEHVKAIGLKRPNFGTQGRPLKVFVNAFETTTIPDGIIYHYDVVISADKNLPARLNMDIIRRLQENIAPATFTPRVVYDGRKNIFSSQELQFPGGADSQTFDVTLSDEVPAAGARGPKVYKVRLTKVAQINQELLHRFVNGDQSHDNTVLTAIMALNVVIRMQPTQLYPFNVRSFFTDRETRTIGAGLVLWRGYFQSVRPSIGRLLINVDISTGTMYLPGRLTDLCLDFFGIRDPQNNLQGLIRALGNDRERLRLQRFLIGVRVITILDKSGKVRETPRAIKKLSPKGAADLTFSMRDGASMTVANYFRTLRSMPLKFPNLLCVEVGNGALIPFELCSVPKGQIYRKQVPPEKTSDVLAFASKNPQDRLDSIKNGLAVLAYGQSQYVRQFGMNVLDSAGLLDVQARILQPPTLRYGAGSKAPTVVPRDGAWNMIGKRFFKPASIERWIVVIYSSRNHFRDQEVSNLIGGLNESFAAVGIVTRSPQPAVVCWKNGQGVIAETLRAAGTECREKTGGHPDLIIAILPEGGNDIYTAVKHFGDVTAGVATQCLKQLKCARAKPQYWANVCLKINVKLGGINTIPDTQSFALLTDPRNPTIVLGADVIHPAPGSDGRPSFTALVANVDSNTAKYIATSRVQTGRQEIISDLKEMAKYVLGKYMLYREKVEKVGVSAPKRIIFYRDGVSEGQFKHVIDDELRMLKEACGELGIKPTITVIIVGKRHHIRLFPQSSAQGDRSGNCPAGTVVDRDIAHPTEFDFYLQSHGGLLGTSRSAHYNIIYDENNFTADDLQSLSFALCHVYARSTRSVSIPAPVYYADIVCSRAKNHYDPQASLDFSESASQLNSGEADASLQNYKRGFKPLHINMANVMYFS